MTERDNFNLAKFIRNNQLLNESFEGFGGYKDLNPLKEVDDDYDMADIKKFRANQLAMKNKDWNSGESFGNTDAAFKINLDGPVTMPMKKFAKLNGIGYKDVSTDFQSMFDFYADDEETLKNFIDKFYSAGMDEEDLEAMYDGIEGSISEIEEGIEDDPQFEDDMSKMINHIVRGYGYIDPEYVQQTWEMASDIPFEEVQDKVFAELVRAGLTNYDDIDEVEEMKEGDEENMNLGRMETISDGRVETGIIDLYKDNHKIEDILKFCKMALDTHIKRVDDYYKNHPRLNKLKNNERI